MSRAGVAVGLTGALLTVAFLLSRSKEASAREASPNGSEGFPGYPTDLPDFPEPGETPIPDVPEFDPDDSPLPKELETHTVRGDGTDWPWDLAAEYTGDPERWPELCAANPQLKEHPQWGCVYPPAGSLINLPASWVRGD